MLNTGHSRENILQGGPNILLGQGHDGGVSTNQGRAVSCSWTKRNGLGQTPDHRTESIRSRFHATIAGRDLFESDQGILYRAWMIMKHSILVVFAGLVATAVWLTSVTNGAAANPPIKVMSFNIRYGQAKDGTNNWPLRRELVVQTIKTFDPDLLGTQEVLDFQAAFLRDQLPGYAFHGVGREDGSNQGEFVPVMFKTNRFELVDSGFFWLSETPEVPGSKSWDTALTRMLSWVVLRDRRGDGQPFVFANVHFDHRGVQARIESAKLIRRKAAELAGQYPGILCGDFNTTEDGQPYQVLVKGKGFGGPEFVDSFRVIHPERSPNEASFHGWTGGRAGSRIDWIIHTPEFATLNAMIDYTNDGGRYPSDHYPVEAVIRLKP